MSMIFNLFAIGTGKNLTDPVQGNAMIDPTDKKIISQIQGDIPLEPRPFAVIAARLGIPEGEVIERIRRLKDHGTIRRFGATLRHQEAGFGANAMVAWRVPENRIDEVGEALASFSAVTHCYHRPPQGDWPYNLYAMVHGSSREACHRTAREMSEAIQIRDYTLLFSEKEFKKTSMAYF